jgi:gamma-glutamyltranspeptidase/glutathione hydrolase
MQVAKAIIARLDWGMTPRDAVGQGLIYFGKDGVILEKGGGLDAFQAPLEAMGHKVVIAPLGLKANDAAHTDSGWEGGADPRSPGVALAE